MSKRRILSCILLFSVLFCVLSFPSLANSNTGGNSSIDNNPDVTDYLVEEMKVNIPGFDPDQYSKEGIGVPKIIGWTLSEDKGEGQHLQAYIFNPNRLYLDGGFAYYKVISSGIPFYYDKSIKLVDYSAGDIARLFVKVEFEYLSAPNISDVLNSSKEEIEYSFTDFQLDLKVAEDSEAITFDLILTDEPMVVSISRNEDNFLIDYERNSVVNLDVKHTVYRTNSTAELGTVDEISSVYFAIPEEYYLYYDKLYSVTASYIKKRTKPYLVTPTPSEYGKDFQYIDPDWDYWYDFFFNFGDGEGHDYMYGNSTVNHPSEDQFRYLCKEYVTFFEACNAFTQISNVSLPSSKVISFFTECEQALFKEYISNPLLSVTYPLSSDYVNEVLYSYVEDYSSGITITLDDTWTSLSYLTSSDANDYFRDYGLWAWWLATFAKDDDSLYNRLVEEGYIDPDNTDYIDAQKLFLCNDQVRNDLSSLSKENFCKNYCINENDYSSFKQYLIENKYVVLLRFDVDTYHFGQIQPMMNLGYGQSVQVNEPYWYAVVEQSLYFDFEIIELTFKDGQEYYSLCTTSEKQNISGGITWVDPDAGFEELPDVDEIIDVLPDFINDNLEDFFGKILSFLRTVGIVLAVVASVVVVVVLFNKGSKIFIAMSNRKNKK